MALQVYGSAPTTWILQNCISQQQQQQGIICVSSSGHRYFSHLNSLMMMRRSKLASRRGVAMSASCCCSLAVGQVTEVNIDTFWPTVKAAGTAGKAIVLDMYTQWCGPCKIMAPRFQQLSEKYQDVVFLKLDCSQHMNRPLAKELGIKVVPTFKIFKDSQIVKEIKGAKFDDLVVAIENARCPAAAALASSAS